MIDTVLAKLYTLDLNSLRATPVGNNVTNFGAVNQHDPEGITYVGDSTTGTLYMGAGRSAGGSDFYAIKTRAGQTNHGLGSVALGKQ